MSAEIRDQIRRWTDSPWRRTESSRLRARLRRAKEGGGWWIFLPISLFQLSNFRFSSTSNFNFKLQLRASNFHVRASSLINRYRHGRGGNAVGHDL